MLTANEIVAFVQAGEGYNVEFKRSVPAKVRELTDEVCAFANAAGGYVLIGISDEGEIVGTKIDNKKRSVIQGSLGEVSPMLNYDMYSVSVDDKELWVIEVPSGKNKPYFHSGVCYVREGANCQKVTNVDEIRDMFQHNDRIYFDAIPMPKVDIQKELDMDTFYEFMHEARLSDTLPIEQVLENLQLFDENGMVKSGGVLFFAKHPEKYFFHAVIRCVLFKGNDKVYILDDKTFTGPLLQQYNKATEWLKGKLEVSYEMEGTEPRKEIWEMPLGVFKEAIVNALSHRDYYEQGASITIEMFDDRVEITNPGTLLPIVAKNFGRKSLTRNPLIFSLFTRMRLVEHIGSGIPRMKKFMLDAGLPEPEYDVDGMFTITLKRRAAKPAVPKKTVELTAIQQQIVDCMKENPQITISELCNKMSLGRTSINLRIKELKELGIVQREGKKNASKWKIL